MSAVQQIFRVRRQYNQWVGNQTLEDYALRFTAKSARHRSIDNVAKTALGATAFLALEAIAAAVTLNYGFTNAIIAMLTVSAVIFIVGFPISYYAAKHGLDIDLLTRGAGFGYLGSTITSLIYASFTFIFFAIEAAILASALQALFNIPLVIGYILCAVAVVPIVIHGISAISKFQIGTQSLWLVLQCAALIVVGYFEFDRIDDWTQYAGAEKTTTQGFDWVLFGAAASVFFALIAQIGEQVDYLRFLPQKTAANRKRWWFWLIFAGPGWVIVGVIKMLLGSFLAYLAINGGQTIERAADPTYMYQMVFNYIIQSPTISLLLAGVMVIISQMKINVTNAYAGSIAWSNFFSRLTHSHPGRVVWLVFNVAIALILMELGIYRALEAILGVFAIIAISWLASVAADLLINKPLGLSPSYVEFKRSHLYDINPVGVGSMIFASVIGVLCYLGTFGEWLKNVAHFVSLLLCFMLVPSLAFLTRGRFYLARAVDSDAINKNKTTVLCCICENRFEHEDMSHCPAYDGAICSLCCSLDSRCLDRCKPSARISAQVNQFLRRYTSAKIAEMVNSRLGRFLFILFAATLVIGGLLALINFQMQNQNLTGDELLSRSLWTIFFVLFIVAGVISWLFLLAHESRVVAQEESNTQTQRLIGEVEAHKETDLALQQAKETAERANHAKSRYLTGISHELRTPLQSILGYAQLLNQQEDIPERHHKALKIIKRSGDYLTDLIEGLLDISKIEAGRLDIYRNQVDLPELLDQLVEMFKPQAEAKGIDFIHEFKFIPTVVIIDERRLRQILINLLSNAIKYTVRGKVEFNVFYRNQVAEFIVKDTGVGISAKDKERILEPFERIRDAEVPNVSGTGLGLTIVKLLSEVMGGDLKIESNPNEGSQFKVSLLLSTLHSPATAKIERHIDGYAGPRKTILVVDDEAIHRGLMFDILQPLGFAVLEAQNADSCLESMTAGEPDLILLDVSMPGMNGLELAKVLRTRGYRKPIIMLSADALERHRKPNDNLAHDEYMVKPINQQKLLEKIGQLLNIEWTSERHNQQKKYPQTKVETIKVKTHPIVKELISHAEIGYKKGVVNTLNTMDALALTDAASMATLRALADSMQFSAIHECLLEVET